jgi:uncharacterized protein involved in exopolysaccharide biosynthesis
VAREPSEVAGQLPIAGAVVPASGEWLQIVLSVTPLAAVIGALLGVAAGAYAFLKPPTFRAQVTLATMGAARPSIAGGGIAANLLTNSLGSAGIQPTAVFIAKLAKLPGVLDGVLRDSLGSGTVASALGAEGSIQLGEEKLGRLLKVAVDDRTGILAVSVVSRDSGLARQIVVASVQELRDAFRGASRAQAEAQRDAQQVRVERARARLTEAERALFEFRASNRMVPETSPFSLILKGLEREASLAESLYSQAVGEREAATAKVLEQAPSLIELDSLPPILPREPRYVVIVTLGVSMVVTLLALAVMVGRRAWRGTSTITSAQR